MILTIDIGNSRTKWVMFQGEEIQDQGVFAYKANSFRSELLKTKLPFNVDVVAISNVAGSHLQDELIDVMNISGVKKYFFAETQSKAFGVTNGYENFSKLGVDRWLAMVAAFKDYVLHESKSVCVIDCGTAITLDLIKSDGDHQGGVIVPGFRLMCSALNNATDNIDENIGNNLEVATGLGLTTSDAVRQGCAQLISDGLSGLIKRFVNIKPENLTCIVTGGDGKWISGMLEHETIYDPVLVNKGLLLMAREAVEEK